MAAAGNITPTLQAPLETALRLAELHQVIRRAHARHVEEIFKLANTTLSIGGGLVLYADALADDLSLVPRHGADDLQLRTDLVKKKQAWVDVEIAQAMHDPFGLRLAMRFQQARHDRGVARTDGWIWHIAEQHAVAIVESEPAVIGVGISSTQLAVVQRRLRCAATLGVDLLAICTVTAGMSRSSGEANRRRPAVPSTPHAAHTGRPDRGSLLIPRL